MNNQKLAKYILISLVASWSVQGIGMEKPVTKEFKLKTVIAGSIMIAACKGNQLSHLALGLNVLYPLQPVGSFAATLNCTQYHF